MVGNRPRRIKQTPRDNAGVAAGHQDNHGFADGASESKDHGGEYSRQSGWQNNLPCSLPFRRTQRERGLGIAAGNARQGILSDREYYRDDRQTERDPSNERIQARLIAEDGL